MRGVIIFKSLIPQSLENRAALRTAIAALAALLIAFFFHFDRPYWSGMTVVILANVYTGSVVDKAILRIIGATIGAWLGYFIAGLVVNSLFLYLLAIFLLISLAIYYYSFSPHAYAYLLGALSAFIVIAQLAVSPAETYYVAIWRPVEIGLGVIVSAISAWCIFPNNIQDNLIKDAELLFDQTGNLLEQLNKLLLTTEADLQTIRADNLIMKRKIRKSVEMFGFVRRELGIKRVKVDQYRALFDQFYNFGRTITYFLSGYHFIDSRTTTRKKVAAFFTAAQQDLQCLKKEFFAKNKTEVSLEAKIMLAKLHKAMTIKSANQKETRSIAEVKGYLQLSPLLQQITMMLNNLASILINSPIPAKSKIRFITNQQQLRNDPDIIINSIKTALSAVLALCFWMVSNWPGGVNGIISSIIISIKKNYFEMKHIANHRFLGCLIGGGLALFPLAFFAMNLYDFMLILFCSVWAFSYFSFKFSNYSYIGLQANVALVIAMGQAGGPPVALEPALERLGGIVIGIVASFLVANVLWRSDFFSVLSRHLQKLFRFLVYNINQLLQQKDPCFYDLTNLFWLCRGLVEAFPNDYFKGLKQKKFIIAKDSFIQMTLIQATISHIYEGIDRESAYAIAASHKIDLKNLEGAVRGLYNAKTALLCDSFKKQIDDFLVKMDLSAVYLKKPGAALSNCIAYINALGQLRHSYPDCFIDYKSEKELDNFQAFLVSK
jgi:uncharacterized membrane protein YccC